MGHARADRDNRRGRARHRAAVPRHPPGGPAHTGPGQRHAVDGSRTAGGATSPPLVVVAWRHVVRWVARSTSTLMWEPRKADLTRRVRVDCVMCRHAVAAAALVGRPEP